MDKEAHESTSAFKLDLNWDDTMDTDDMNESDYPDELFVPSSYKTLKPELLALCRYNDTDGVSKTWIKEVALKNGEGSTTTMGVLCGLCSQIPFRDQCRWTSRFSITPKCQILKPEYSKRMTLVHYTIARSNASGFVEFIKVHWWINSRLQLQTRQRQFHTSI